MPETKRLTYEDFETIFLNRELRLISSRTDLFYEKSEKAVASISTTRWESLGPGGWYVYYQTCYMPTAQAMKLHLTGNMVPNRPIMEKVKTLEEAWQIYDETVNQDWVV